eukprot:m.557313 g.557313  ORF g.557313 m.557313 type:complete len:60 (+) comp22189_c2_seq29:1302-1481(+)
MAQNEWYQWHIASPQCMVACTSAISTLQCAKRVICCQQISITSDAHCQQILSVVTMLMT